MHSGAPLGWLDGLALGLFALGFVFEAVGDWQLARFKGHPENVGKVLDRGLWRYTRHPNYFGNACIWWGFFLFALATGAVDPGDNRPATIAMLGSLAADCLTRAIGRAVTEAAPLHGLAAWRTPSAST